MTDVYTEPIMSILRVFFGVTKIQKLRRIALDPNLLETLKLKEGDAVRVELDVAAAAIVIRKAGPAEVSVTALPSRGTNA